MKVVVHPKSEQMLRAIESKAPHAVLLTGPYGIGLSTIAGHYFGDSTARHIVVLPEKDEKVDIEKGTITVQSIRRLYDTTRTLEPAGRVIIIDYAERMAVPAQNAFLKLLEEPSEGTRFVLLTHNPESLLPTIQSRSQRIDVRPITLEQSNDLLDVFGVHDSTKRAQLLFIAEGLPAELARLASDDALFNTRAEIVKDARQLVMGSTYDKLLLGKKYKDTRSAALVLLEDAMKMLQRSIVKGGDTTSLRMLGRLETIHRRISEQGNVRLQLSALGMVY